MNILCRQLNYIKIEININLLIFFIFIYKYLMGIGNWAQSHNQIITIILIFNYKKIMIKKLLSIKKLKIDNNRSETKEPQKSEVQEKPQ